jgi:prephenate dehydrogenase
MAVALTLSTPSEAAPMVGPGFSDVSRLAGSDTEMMIDILASNNENVLRALARFRGELQDIEDAVRGGDRAALEILLKSASEQRDLLIGNRVSNESND